MRATRADPDGRQRRSPWSDVVTSTDQAAYLRSGYVGSQRLGRRPALLVIDMNRNFLGDRPEPLAASQRRFPYSCGLAGWRALPRIRAVLEQARTLAMPVFFTTGVWRELDLGQMTRNERARSLLQRPENGAIVPELTPLPTESVIVKPRPSAFFGTPLVAYLFARGVDTVLVTGNTTSGCIRATAVDSYSYGFATAVLASCVFDRSRISHKISLFDLHHKYATVLNDVEVKKYFAGIRQDAEEGRSTRSAATPAQAETPQERERAAADARRRRPVRRVERTAEAHAHRGRPA